MVTGAQLQRRDVVAMLLDGRDELAVVTGLGSPTYDVAAVQDHERNFYLWGAMGSAVTVGLGLAMARPELPVAVITGDGEQLMGLGALATCAVKNPANLTIVVLDNGHYGETGMQLSHSGRGLSLHQVAKACGFPLAYSVSEQNGLVELKSQIQQPRQLCFANVEVSSAETERVLPSRDGARIKHRFRASLGLEPTV